MLKFKPRQLNESELIEKIKDVLTQCEVDDFQTKKFKGLLHDYIPNDTGLKARLELLGQSGYLQKLIKLKSKKGDQSDQINKLAQEFSQTYGFYLPTVLQTIDYVAIALEMKPHLKVAPTMDALSTSIIQEARSQGNFSKKHFESEKSRLVVVEPTLNHSENQKEQVHLPKEKRNKPLFFGLILFLYVAVISGSYYYLLNYYGDMQTVFNTLESIYVTGVRHPWVITTVASTVCVVGLSFILYHFKRYYFPKLIPLMMLFIELVASALYVALPQYFEMIQMALWSIVIFSFALMLIPAFGKRYNKKVIFAKRTIVPYFFTALLFIGSQIMVRQFL